MNANKTLAAYASILIGAGIAFGAFGAHWLKPMISAHYLQTFDTGVRYQIYNGLGLLILAISGLNAKWAFRFILFGTMVFSASLYLLAFNTVGYQCYWLYVVGTQGTLKNVSQLNFSFGC